MYLTVLKYISSDCSVVIFTVIYCYLVNMIFINMIFTVSSNFMLSLNFSRLFTDYINILLNSWAALEKDSIAGKSNKNEHY